MYINIVDFSSAYCGTNQLLVANKNRHLVIDNKDPAGYVRNGVTHRRRSWRGESGEWFEVEKIYKWIKKK